MMNISKVIHPPVKSKNLISDIRYFILNKPETNTLVHTHSTEEREEYDHRILQLPDFTPASEFYFVASRGCILRQTMQRWFHQLPQ